jgi:hypothetical protein
MRVKGYTGRPIKSTNCWEFICEYYWCELGVSLDNYSGELHTRQEKMQFASFWNKYLESSDWEEVDKPQYPDIAVFDIKGTLLHSGIVVGDGVMLHMQLAGSTVETYRGERWCPRLYGFYRYTGTYFLPPRGY